MRSKIAVSEIFGPVVQGEGLLAGWPTVFVRTGGCDYRCSWCDTMYAVDPKFKSEWADHTPEEVFRGIENLTRGKPILVTLSGGNPALQPLGELLEMGHELGYKFAIETQGSLARPWFKDLDFLTLSPKPPSSKMPTNWKRLEQCCQAAGKGTGIVFKVVVFDDADYAYAKEVRSKMRDYISPGNFHLSVGTVGYDEINATGPGDGSNELGTESLRDAVLSKYRWLIDKVTTDQWFDVVVLPQLHTLTYGAERGV
jgi:7-carboxy-7-deazaguanine synthase